MYVHRGKPSKKMVTCKTMTEASGETKPVNTFVLNFTISWSLLKLR